MNIALLAFAFVFIFNPAINVIDPLPDFIGWIFIFSSLKRVRYISVQMESAANSATKMAWLNFAGFICFFLTPHIDGTMILTITFALNTMKLVWGIPAFKYFFDGLSELSSLYDGKSIYKPLGRSKNEGIHTVERFTYVFLAASCVLNTLPEFTELSGQSSLIMSEGHRNWLSFKPMFYVVCITASLIFGIVWLSLILPFMKRFGSEKEFAARIADGYKLKIVDTGKHRAITLISAFFLASIAGLFILCVMLDDMNIVPRFIMPVMMLVISLMVGKTGYKTRLFTVVSALTSLASVIAYFMRWAFVINFSYDSVTRSFAAYDFYIATFYVLLAELVLLIIQHVIWTRLIFKIAEQDAVRESLAVNADTVASHNAFDIKKNKQRACVSLSLFIVACTLNVSSFIICHEFPESWIAVLILSLVWFAYAYNFYSGLRDTVEHKYL
ncbi:MAG: hypothetical protein IJ391_07145 [Clostridia bacterium]|nr:hypothetical protein [Clostridia bacterium]